MLSRRLAIRRMWRAARRTPLAVLGASLVLLFAIIAACASWIAPHDPLAQDLGASLQPPSPAHALGTDELGRDILSRLLVASRVDLLIALGGIFLALAIAVPTGLAAGYLGGRVDTIVSSLTDSLLTFPTLVLAVILVSLVGSGGTSLVLAVALTTAPSIARVVRGLALELRGQEFVDAARALGAGHDRVVLRHILPNTVGRVVVISSVLASQSILTVTALGFLGLGIQPPAPEWGTMLAKSRTHLASAPHLMVFPGLAISGFVLGMNLIGDVLRDVLDPRTQWST